LKTSPLLTECGSTKFSLPSDGNATKMVLYNGKFKSMITYIDWDKHNSIDKAVKLQKDKLLDEQSIRDERVIESLCIYFRNSCVLLSEKSEVDFFKDGNGKSGKKASKKSDNKEQNQRPTYSAYKYSKNGRVSLHESIILIGTPIFLSCDNGKIQLYETIQEDIRVIKPPHPENYPYQPYEFENILNSNGKGKSGNSSNTSTIGVSTPDIRATKNWLKNIRRALVGLLRNYGGNNKNKGSP
jgi:hypothetical protein